MKTRDSISLYIFKSKPVIIIGLLFLLVNALWLLTWSSYRCNAQGYQKNSFLYSQRIGKYSCNVSAPKYLRFRGNYTVANENGIILIVWPHTFFSWKTDYGIDFGDGDSGYRFYIDNNINYLRDETMRYSKEEEEAISRILDENRSEIEDMFELIENEWGIK